MKEFHEKNISYCIHLAQRGLSQVSPNPMVGAVLIYNQQIIGQGWHQYYGGPHAEQNAIDNAVELGNQHLISESTLYVSLEPCNHYGKTPPCTQLIIKYNIKRVVFGTFDPNPTMAGKSINKLMHQGIEVVGPILKTKCDQLIQMFRINMLHTRPYVILKFAQSADFFISNWEHNTKISNPYTDILVHKWRSEVDGILIGRITLQTDNPMLNNRHWYGKNPKIIIWTTQNQLINSDYNVFKHSENTILTSQITHENTIESILKSIYLEKKLGVILVEGGAKVLNGFIESGFWDEARIITNTKLRIQNGVIAPKIQGKLIESDQLLNDKIQYIQR